MTDEIQQAVSSTEPPSLPQDCASLTPPPLPGAGVSTRGRICTGLVLILACCLLLAYVAHLELVWLDGEPWSYAVARIDDGEPPTGARPARIRPVPSESLPPDTPFVAAIREGLGPEAANTGDGADMLQLMGVGLAESIIMMPASDEELAAVLESGRVPKRGAPELLAGVLARQDSFKMDGETFRVVGRIKGSVGGTAFAYLLPDEEGLAARHFSDAVGARAGWYLPDAEAAPREELVSRLESAREDAAAFLLQPVPQTPTRPAYTAASLLALLVGAVGGYLLHDGLFRGAAANGTKPFWRVYREVVRWPRLFMAMHVFLYGTFFIAMLAGAQNPLANIGIGQFVAGQFMSGGLSYIGDAYASGHIFSATAATFYNNYFWQTLMFTFVASLLPLALGILKTVASFVLTGFTMVPLWNGTAAGYSYHSITMVLELEAYIVACFAVMVWTIGFYRALFRGMIGSPEPRALAHQFWFYVQAAVLCGLMLVIAAGYEATTLILIGGR